ncbi:MAG: phosphodiester glycosidase family protein, partial [Bacteroidales bacterium]
EYLSGIYSDKLPWNGVYAKVNVNNPTQKWVFRTLSSDNQTKKVTKLANEFNKATGNNVKIAWNGGYILNPELVGKLGLPESYIGSPLGLLVSDKKIVSPPLYNKAALLIYDNGKIDIKKANSNNGISVSRGKTRVNFTRENYNLISPGQEPCYYDLMFKKEEIITKNRVVIRLAGNVIKDIIKDREKVKIIPVGLTLSFPENKFPPGFDELEAEVDLKVGDIKNIVHAVEAGPLLVDNGAVAINMEDEGWTTMNSIHTQAARLDYTDMRGPKIAAGLDKEGNLLVLTVNGRIRESVGATHVDMAEIMVKLGAEKAMGFDPGGSSTLVVNNNALNISPYNKDYEKNNYSLPPEPRAVSNAIIGYTEKEI